MSVQFLAAWNGFESNQVVDALPAAEEARLIVLGICRRYAAGQDGQSSMAVTQNALNGQLGQTAFAAKSGIGQGAPIGRDLLTGAVEHFVRTTALGTAVGVQARPVRGTHRSVRISSTNLGANAAAKLFVALNFADDVEALYWSQRSQRDAQLVIGDALVLRSPRPITSVFMSADMAIADATHRLLISFGD